MEIAQWFLVFKHALIISIFSRISLDIFISLLAENALETLYFIHFLQYVVNLNPKSGRNFDAALERLYQEAKEQQGNAYNENSLVEEPEEPCAKSCEETDEDDETYTSTILDEKNFVYLRADMYRIINKYTGEEKTHCKFDEILDEIIKFYLSIGEGKEINIPSYNEYILPMLNKQKRFSYITCVYFASLLSSYLAVDKGTGFIKQLLKKETFSPRDFFKWKTEMQIHISKIRIEALIAIINKISERNDAKQQTEEENARTLKGFIAINQKTRKIKKKYEDLYDKLVTDAWDDKLSFDDYAYDYYDSVNKIPHFKCFDELLDITFILLSGKENKFNKNKIEQKYGEISLLLNSLPYDKKNEQLNYYGDRIARIHAGLLECFKDYLTTLKSDMIQNKDGAMTNVADFIVLHKKDCLKVNDESITVLVEELGRV